MIKKLLPVVLLVAGLAAGVGAGIVLAPKDGTKADPPTVSAEEKPGESTSKDDSIKKSMDESGAHDYFKLSKQFVVPIVEHDRISALVTMSLSLETRPGLEEEIYKIEPKLRDGFLQVLFDHANTGGFDGAFTESGNLETLRRSLLDVAKQDMGDDVSGVLIMSVSRQDT